MMGKHVEWYTFSLMRALCGWLGGDRERQGAEGIAYCPTFPVTREGL